MLNSNCFQQPVKTAARLSYSGVAGLVIALLLGNLAVLAGTMHAKSVIGLGVNNNRGFNDAPAHAERHQGSKYRITHEEWGSNYTYGNAGSGHAHHHSGPFHHSSRFSSPSGPSEQDRANSPKPETPIPVVGSRGSSQYIKQTWLQNAAGDKMDVTWVPETFLQIDPTELRPGEQLVSRASLTAPGLVGALELTAKLDRNRKPVVDTRLTGVFKGLKFEVITHPNGVISLQFTQPLAWSVPGKAQTFDVALDASIETKRIAR